MCAERSVARDLTAFVEEAALQQASCYLACDSWELGIYGVRDWLFHTRRLDVHRRVLVSMLIKPVDSSVNRQLAVARLFHAQPKVSGKRPKLCTVYGLRLRNRAGLNAAYIGCETSKCRPESFVAAVAVGGGLRHPQWDDVPGRLQSLWKDGFRHHGKITVLRNVPRSTETAAAFACEEVVGQGKSIGGLLALDSRVDVVHDACQLQRLHDQQLCVCCGYSGHFAKHTGVCKVSSLAPEQLPFRAQRLRAINDNLASSKAAVESAQHLKRVADSSEHVVEALKRARSASNEPMQPQPGARSRDEVLAVEPRAWASSTGPRLEEAKLREALSTCRVDDEYRADVEQELGGVSVDLAYFAKNVVALDHARSKKPMKKAKVVTEEAGLRQRFGYAWVQKTYPKHVAAAIRQQRLVGEVVQYQKKMRVRGGGEDQGSGVVVLLESLVAMYKKTSE
jgi:hypothetical protein